jgi:Flp pilus assembly protein TadG
MQVRSRNGITLRSMIEDRGGATAVEMALLAPIYILLLMGMVAFGIYLGASHSVQQLASDAARASISGLTEAERQQIANGFIARNAAGYAFVDPVKLRVLVADNETDATQFRVAVTYDARDLPIWTLLRDLPLPDTTIERRSTIRIGGL